MKIKNILFTCKEYYKMIHFENNTQQHIILNLNKIHFKRYKNLYHKFQKYFLKNMKINIIFGSFPNNNFVFNKLFSKIYQQKTKKNTVIFCDNLLHSLTGINHLINNLCNGDTIEFYDFNETEENTTKILITSNKFLLSEKYKHIYFIPINKNKPIKIN